jgi:hypothetical protein
MDDKILIKQRHILNKLNGKYTKDDYKKLTMCYIMKLFPDVLQPRCDIINCDGHINKLKLKLFEILIDMMYYNCDFIHKKINIEGDIFPFQKFKKNSYKLKKKKKLDDDEILINFYMNDIIRE